VEEIVREVNTIKACHMVYGDVIMRPSTLYDFKKIIKKQFKKVIKKETRLESFEGWSLYTIS
jgi:hypothetical protein